MSKYTFKVKPAPYQLEALKRALKEGKYGIFFQQRIGKTKVAVDFCGAKYCFEERKKVLIVSPLSVRLGWVEEINKNLSDSIPHKVYIYPQKDKTLPALWEGISFVIINYDRLKKQATDILEWQPDIIIFDESHLLRNYKSLRSKSAYAIAKTIPYRLLLTGTPIPKYPHDIFMQFKIMNEHIMGNNWYSFRNRHCKLGGFMGKEIIGWDAEYIQRAIGNHSIRVLRKDVFDEPEIEDIIVPVSMNIKSMLQYAQLKKIFITEIEGAKIVAEMAGVRLMRLQQFCGGFIPDEEGNMLTTSTEKMDALMDLVSTRAEGGEKVVVFARFTAEIEEMVRRFKLIGVNAVLYNGSVSEEDRYKNINEFQNDETCNCIIIQISTGAMGITLDKAHVNVFYSLDFSLSNLLQAKDRIMGRGQKSSVVTNYYLACINTVDHKIMDTLKNNEDLATEIADKWRWLIE